MDFKNYLFLSVVALLTTIFKLLKGVNMSAKIKAFGYLV